MNFYRPVIRLSLTVINRLLNLLSFAAFVMLWVYTIYLYSTLPSTIPVHFDLNGNINRYGSKHTIWILAGIATIIYAGLTLLIKYPHIYNYPFGLTAENTEKEYRRATQLIRWLRLSILIVFIVINSLIQTSTPHHPVTLVNWIFPVIFSFMLIPTVIYFYQSLKK